MKESKSDTIWQRLIRQLLRTIYPLKLREKLSYRLQGLFPDLGEQNVSFEYNRSLRFDLSKKDIGHIPIIYNGFYEKEVTKVVLRLAKQGGILIDVGANYGYFSCIWAYQNKKNRAHAFEASSLNITPLKNNIDKNNLTSQVKVVPYALGKENGVLNFCHEREKQQTGWGGFTLDKKRKSELVEVQTLDTYTQINKITTIDLLKIDTEGADAWVLQGASQLLKEQRIKHIFFEHNQPRMALLKVGLDTAKNLLEGNGYVVQALSEMEYYSYPKVDLIKFESID
ncbi:FkbM family methyltransferase [Roseivirga sp.]|uniref:FkbM family methyltransferase n=1 Tax=Roseivirga sp. TaxID=1964215 RepID=UPI003B5198B6